MFHHVLKVAEFFNKFDGTNGAPQIFPRNPIEQPNAFVINIYVCVCTWICKLYVCGCVCVCVCLCMSACLFVCMYVCSPSLSHFVHVVFRSNTPNFCGHLRPKPSAVHVVPAGVPQSGIQMVTVALGENLIQNRHQKPQMTSHFFGVFSRTSSDCTGLRCQKLNMLNIIYIYKTCSYDNIGFVQD